MIHIPFNKPSHGSSLAGALLDAHIQLLEKKEAAALALFHTAIAFEDSLIYREPKDWMLPARQFLGEYLLSVNKKSAAEKIYREDLVQNPGNGWSLNGVKLSRGDAAKKRRTGRVSF